MQLKPLKELGEKMDEKAIIEQYYRKFSEISYKGTSAKGFHILWNYMERIYKDVHFNDVLEVGATHLEHLKYVKHSFTNYYATDINPHEVDAEAEKMIKKLPDNVSVKVKYADAMSLPFEDNYFDRTLTTCLFHHLSKPELAMQELLRVTKSGGVISFFLPYDPGVLFNVIRGLTTRRNAKKLHLSGEISSPKLIWALEHRNHVEGIRVLIKEIYKDQELKIRHIPPFIKSSNLGVCEFYDVRKS
jgi:phosphatidylethanolamine/phosphatidyl-N-methylethanolamine N-methyltransferase